MYVLLKQKKNTYQLVAELQYYLDQFLCYR